MVFSLKKKTVVLVVIIAVMISLVAVAVFNHMIRKVIETQYKARSIDIVNLVSLEIDAEKLLNVRQAVREIYDKADDKVMSDRWGTPEFEAYVARFSAVEEMEDYQTLLADLRKMQDVLDVNCLTLIWLDTERECYLYLVDADYDDPCPIGCIDPLFIENAEALTDPSVGFPPNISNSPEYGWLIATAMPVFDDQANVIAFAAVDISMNAVMEQGHRYLLYTVLAFFAATVIVCLLGIWLVTRFVIRPVNILSQAAAQYTHGKKSFSELNIPTGDEIGLLADSMRRMETDISEYIDSLEKTTGDLIAAREDAEQFNRIANIDPLTKVRNKRAYDLEAERINHSEQPYGIVMIDLNGLKEINDTYGHEKGDISIKCLCRIICQTFKHSPVYRIGGDEFIVILENDDYANRDELIRSTAELFRNNADNAALPVWERVTASVGCAVFTPGKDSGVDDVFNRADKAMYSQKKTIQDARETGGSKT